MIADEPKLNGQGSTAGTNHTGETRAMSEHAKRLVERFYADV
jgi:hypothetical protein